MHGVEVEMNIETEFQLFPGVRPKFFPCIVMIGGRGE